MTKRLKNIILPVCITLTLWHCKDPYNSPYSAPVTGYLVVEGYVTGNGATRIMLSRTMPLAGNGTLKTEDNAQVQIEGDDNNSWKLTTVSAGTYTIDTLPLQSAVKYRVRILTTNGHEYLSDFIPYRSTPPIDSINWAVDGDNLEIYANTHDASGATRYYQWEYEETWRYFTTEQSLYRYQEPPGVMVRRNDDEQITSCWGDRVSTRILIGSSAKLSEDVISRQLLTKVLGPSLELSTKYSILVRQYALTEDAYNYLSLMQKNSETLGSIFDAQPVQLKGNIHCLTNQTEQVIGFVSAGTIQQQRIYINRSQLPSRWNFNNSCPLQDRTVPNLPDSIAFYFSTGKAYTPIDEVFNNVGMLVGWIGNETSCVDCRAAGGVTIRPVFWPN